MSRLTKYVLTSLTSLILAACGGNAQHLNEGDIAPDFTAQDAYSTTYTLSSYTGNSPVVVYFYPKANTAGCTKEACGIRDSWSKFKENNITVLGVSVDSKESLKEFIDDHNLNFPLLSDEDKSISKKYGVLNNIGLASRVTFIIDKEGRINHIIRDVDVDTHAEQVYNIASKLL